MTDRLRLDKDDHEPWLKYPDPNKQHRPFYTHKHSNHTSSYHGHHSRSSAGTTPPVPGLLHHKRSASRLAQQQDLNSLSSLSSNSNNNSSSDSLGQWHPSPLTSTTTTTDILQQQHLPPQPQQPLQSKPRSLSDELSFALSQDSQSSAVSAHANGLGSYALRPSPLSPSDILGIPDRSDSPSLRRLQRSSPLPLSLNTHSNGDSSASSLQQQTSAPSVSFSSPAYSSFSSGGSTTASEEPLSPRAGLPPPAPLAAALSSPSASSSLLSTTQQQQTVPRLSHSLSLSSSSSASSSSGSSTSSSTPSSPSSSTAPCSALCRHSQSRHSYTDRHHPSPSSSSQPRHHPACIHGHGHGAHGRRTHSVHRNPRHHHHRPSCPQTSLSHGSELSPFGKHAPDDFAATGASASSPSLVGHAIAADQDVSITTSPLSLLPVQQQEDVQMHDQKEVDSRSLSREDEIPFPDDILLLEKASPSTAVTVVDTKAYGIQAYKALRDRDLFEQHPYLGEPPKKKMRSTAAMLFGAAVETVIFTGAVALSAYQLLTGKGRQATQAQEEAVTEVETETPPTDASLTPDDVLAQPEAPESAKPLMIESAPVNIPSSSRSLHHRHSGHFKRSPQAAGSLHHSQYVHGHHRHHHHHHHHHPHHTHSSSHRKSSRRQGGLVSSLPHSSHMSAAAAAAARGEDPYSQNRQPTRPNTGTEDNDEQFLRMEAQLSTLIAEGKRALGSEIPDWRKFPTGSTIY
ncbi:hypothetical protein EMPS_07200 [Entomortierella parvispora]|uniref:Uncharacterized protein n=1 Tax=Entomortierella parvispora TaxID=205924 RepID=A0A9P3LY72_9FUNG|nr:hypothetical protein EMPS_07200 [Entomortierella parvispora]